MKWIFAVVLLAAPLYVWRFTFGSADLNALLVICFAAIAVAGFGIIANKKTKQFLDSVYTLPKALKIFIALFFVAGTMALFVGGFDVPKLGQWLVLFAQPIVLFLLLRFYSIQDEDFKNKIESVVYILVGITGVVAITQYLTLFGLPPDWWGNSNEPKRAISIFAHPNAFALFVTPLLAWLLPSVFQKLRSLRVDENEYDISAVFSIILWAVGIIGMFLSLSRGAWLGFAAACAIYALVSRNKKVIMPLVVAGIVAIGVVAAIPNLRYRAILPFKGEKSTVARFSLWETGLKMVKDDPIFGKGLNGFNYNWDKYNTDPNLQHYNYPHNIFLNVWVDFGIIGLIGFVGVLLLIVLQGIGSRNNRYRIAMLMFVVAMVVHGLIDIPYLKNDLALAFWLLLAVSI